MELTVLAVSFTVLLLIGVPVAFAIGLSSIATILAADLPMAVVFQKMVGGMQVFSFLAIPFFVFAGELMLYGGIADKIVTFAKNLVGHVRGGLGMSNVIACTLFGGIMAWSGWGWTLLKWSDPKPMLHVPVGMDYLALVVAGVLIVMFSLEHVIALLRDEEVVPAWN